MPTKKFVLRRKYKEYLDPTAKDWYNAIFNITDFENRYIEDARYRGGEKAAEKERIRLNQEAINTADDIERIYRTRAKRYIQGRKERESNPNFIGPTIPISIKTLPFTTKESIEIANRAEGDHPLDYDPNHTIMITRDAHWPEKGWQEGATVTYPIDTLHNIYPTNKNPNFVHYKLGGNLRKKAVLGDYDLSPAIVSAQGKRIPGLSAYNRVIGPVPTIDRSFPDISKIESKPILTQVANPTPPTIAGTRPIMKSYTPSLLERYGLNTGDVVAGGIQLAGNLTSSLINQVAINRPKFTPLHTTTAAEAPVKFDTNYNINPQVDELREMEAANEREIRDNTASSQNVVGRTVGSRFRTNRGYNELYGHKLNQQANIKNAEAQNRQGVYQRNTDRLQRNLYRDEAYNTQGEDNLRNTKATLTGQNWSNSIQQATDSLIGAYNRGQQRISDSNSLGFLLASDPNSAKLFMNNNSLINRIFRTARRMQGIYG